MEDSGYGFGVDLGIVWLLSILGSYGGFEGRAIDPLYATKSSILNVECMPQSLGISMTYPFSLTLERTSKGPIPRACNFRNVPGGKRSGRNLIITKSPTSKRLYLR